MDKKNHWSFRTLSRDRTFLYGQCWMPNSYPLAVLYIVHGLGGHSGRFADLAQFFRGNGLAVIAIDLRGHGRSDGKRGHVNSIKAYCEDIDSAIYYGRKLLGVNIPQFLFGSSMGGAIVLSYIHTKNKKIAGCIVTAPWFRLTRPLNKVYLNTLFFINVFYPSFTISSQIRSSDLRRDDKFQEEENIDELVHKRISVRLLSQIHYLGESILCSDFQLSIPILIFHGDKDSVTDFKASEEFASMHSEICDFVPLKDELHQIHLEADDGKLITHIVNWIQQILKNE
jgi:alpha-beta hydrolase superfamily lysophospholipase